MSAALYVVGIVVGLFVWLVVRSLIQETVVEAWHHLTYNRRIRRDAKRWVRNQRRSPCSSPTTRRQK